jgi:hypothetical protein
MMRWLFLMLALLLVPEPAWAPPAFTRISYSVVVNDATDLVSRRRLRFFGAGVTCSDNAITGTTECSIAGGGSVHELLSATHTDTTPDVSLAEGELIVFNSGAWEEFPRGTANQVLAVNGGGTDIAWTTIGTGGTGGHIGVSSLTLVSGASTLFMADGTGVDVTEDDVEQKVLNAMTFDSMQCIASADPGSGDTITVTGRTGTCGALSNSGSFTCDLVGGSGRPICDTGANTLAVSATECWSIGVTFSDTDLGTDVFVNCTMERDS